MTPAELHAHAEWVVAADGQLELGRWTGEVENLPACEFCCCHGALIALREEGDRLVTATADDIGERPVQLICRSCLR